MQLVVCDTNILFPGLVAEDSLYRKLLIVFAWGKLHSDLRAAEDEQKEIERLLNEFPDAEIGGGYDPSAIVHRAEERIAALEEHLPPMTPREFGLAISAPITQELEEVMRSERSRLGGLSDEVIEQNIALAAAISTTHIVHGFDSDIPPYTEGRDVKDDPIVHTAVLAGAEWILSLDEHIVVDKKRPTVYTDPETGTTHPAVGLRHFLNTVICTGYHFDTDALKSIDGQLLRVALAAVS